MHPKAVCCVGVCILLAVALTASADTKPRRGKHYISPDKLGTVTTEDIDELKVVEDESFVDKIKNDARLKGWVKWWKGCASSFTIDDMVDAGVVALGGEWVAADKGYTVGPNREFLIRRGGKSLHPVWGRMRYVKTGSVWQGEMRNFLCGVMLYEGDRERKIVHCGELDGVFGGFWADGSRAVITAYRKISPAMSAECEAKNVGECIAPILWLVDLAGESVWEYRGPVVTYADCEPNEYLMQHYAEFFGLNKDKGAADAAR